MSRLLRPVPCFRCNTKATGVVYTLGDRFVCRTCMPLEVRALLTAGGITDAAEQDRFIEAMLGLLTLEEHHEPTHGSAD
jgi:hypothetical protein